MQEREAVQRLKNGDIGGLEPLIREHALRAQRAAFLITRDRALSEDVVQEAFIRAYERIGSFDPSRPFGPWFLRSVTNAAIDAAGRCERRDARYEGGNLAAGFADLLPDAALGPEGTLEQAELRREVWAALGHLPPKQRAAVVMRYYLDLSEAEIAEQLAVPSGTVKSRLNTARGRLKALLGPFRGVDQ